MLNDDNQDLINVYNPINTEDIETIKNNLLDRKTPIYNDKDVLKI
jgi:hypothetical protein